ncbi:hypothetical protein Cni_G08366 [Canna indica]|uniref:Uncharacterized protein n=1 Tax=Canna indica TaxID=4628 RepID=A0AAQ3Q8L3_9LILI|nr:hypothetical protein Cni_G08366 [Canna indica]
MLRFSLLAHFDPQNSTFVVLYLEALVSLGLACGLLDCCSRCRRSNGWGTRNLAFFHGRRPAVGGILDVPRYDAESAATMLARWMRKKDAMWVELLQTIQLLNAAAKLNISASVIRL